MTKRKTLFQLAGIVLSLGLIFIPSLKTNAATLSSLNRDVPGVTMTVSSYPTVVVRNGDTLSKLASEYRLPWQGVWCANKKVIGPDPNVLRAGERLVMKSSSCPSYSGYGRTTTTITTAEYNTTGSPQHIAWGLLANFGGSRPIQYLCLSKIIARESGWSVTAANASGAYGIPQALPGWKMGPGWQYSAYVQLHWMIKDYIPSSYGTPCQAWWHEIADGWY